MDLRSAIIINNSPVAASALPAKKIKSMVDYVSREGRFDIGGCASRVTDEDARIMARADVSDMIDYAAREGRFEYRRASDTPLAPGDRSGGLWGRDGVIDSASWKKLVAESGSHVMRSVVTVRREDAQELGLATKEDWQRVIRANWDAYARSWGIISPGDIEWAAAYHVDGKESLHVHIMTIDRSGRWSQGSPDIPHRNHIEGFTALRRELYRPLIVREEAEASALRDWMCARVRAHLGERDLARELALHDHVARATSIDLPLPSENTLARVEADRVARTVLDARPEGDARVLSYARSSEEVRSAARELARKLREEDPTLERAYRRYEQIQHDKAIVRGFTGVEMRAGHPVDLEEEAVRTNMFDLNKRLANAGLSSLRHRTVERERVTVPGRGAALPRAEHDGAESREVREEERAETAARASSTIDVLVAGLVRELAHALGRSAHAPVSHAPRAMRSENHRERNTHRAMTETRMMER